MTLIGTLTCSQNTSSPASHSAGTNEPPTRTSSPAKPSSIAVAGISCKDRAASVAFSPDGQWLAHVEGTELVIRSVAERVSEVARANLGAQRIAGIAFAGNDTLGAIVLDQIGEGKLLSFAIPDWKQVQSIDLFGLAPRVVVGHPSMPHVLVAPRPAIQWGRDEAQKKSRNEGFAVYDLRSGAVAGGAGPLGNAIEQLTLTWTNEGPMSMWRGRLVHWSPKDGTTQSSITVTEASDLCHVVSRGPGVSLLGWASPPRVGVLGAAPVALDDLGDLLYQLIAQPQGLTVAIVLAQKDGHVEQIAAQVLVKDERRERWPLEWPLAGAALHPTLPLLAWIEGSPASGGTLRLMRLTDGKGLPPEEPLGFSR